MRKITLAEQVFFDLIKSGSENVAIDYIKNDISLLKAKSETSFTVLEIAIQNKCQKLIDWLLANGYNPNIFENTALGNKNIIAKILNEQPTAINEPHENGCSLIHIASYYGHSELALCLIEKGANIFAKNKKNVNALDIAMQNSDIEMIEILLNVDA